MFPDIHSVNNFLFNVPTAKVTVTGLSIGSGSTATVITGWTTMWAKGGAKVVTDGIAVPRAGVYQVNAFEQWATNTTGRRTLHILVNGVDIGEIVNAAPASGVNTVVNYATTVSVKRGDKIGLDAEQTSGGALVLQPAVFSVAFLALTK